MNETLVVVLCASLGMLVQSFAGFAGSLVAVPLLAMFISPREAVPTYSLVMLVVDIWLVYETRRHVQWSRLKGLLAGGLIGVPIGAYGLTHLPGHAISICISAITLAFGILFLAKVRINMKENAPTQLSVGLLSGLLGGSISESGPPVVVYGLARDWGKDTFRSTLLCYFLALCVEQDVSYWYFGLFSRKSVSIAAVAIIPTFLAASCGVHFKNRVSETIFRRAILIVVIGVSVMGLTRSVWR